MLARLKTARVTTQVMTMGMHGGGRPGGSDTR
jgi:hypothetical protein